MYTNVFYAIKVLYDVFDYSVLHQCDSMRPHHVHSGMRCDCTEISSIRYALRGLVSFLPIAIMPCDSSRNLNSINSQSNPIESGTLSKMIQINWKRRPLDIANFTKLFSDHCFILNWIHVSDDSPWSVPIVLLLKLSRVAIWLGRLTFAMLGMVFGNCLLMCSVTPQNRTNQSQSPWNQIQKYNRGITVFNL